MMDFITHGFRHCVIGVGWDSRWSRLGLRFDGVGWDSDLMEFVRTRYMGHGESHLIHGM